MPVGNEDNDLILQDDRHRVVISPAEGAGLVRLDALLDDSWVPILRPRLSAGDGVFGLAMNLLAPFSNRISSGGFEHEGVFHELAPNLAGEAFPIHGDSLLKSWTVLMASDTHAHLRLNNGTIGPWVYQADLHYELDEEGLKARLEMSNHGRPLPFGGGFHPWFPRHADTRLQFSARNVWLEDAQHMPTQHVALEKAGFGVFDEPTPLPAAWVNNAFTGWNGHAQINQPSLGIEVLLQAESPMDVAILYSPDAKSDFFCFEPVSHAVDAHNQPGQPGLVILDTNEQLTLSMQLRWRELTAGCD